jgi:hypothetical protein
MFNIVQYFEFNYTLSYCSKECKSASASLIYGGLFDASIISWRSLIYDVVLTMCVRGLYR